MCRPQSTKTNPQTCRTLTLIWGTNKLPGYAAGAEVWYHGLLKAHEAHIGSVDIAPDTASVARQE